MVKLANKVENIERGTVVTVITEDHKKYTGEMCETQGRVGRELCKLLKSDPQTVLTVKYSDSNKVDQVVLEFESGLEKDVASVHL